MPLKALFHGIGQVTVHHTPDAGTRGQPRETLCREQFIGVYVQVDISVTDKQSHAQRADQMHLGADLLPSPHQIGTTARCLLRAAKFKISFIILRVRR